MILPKYKTVSSRKWYFSSLLNWTRWFRWSFQNFEIPNFSQTFRYTFITGIFRHFYPHFPTFLRTGQFSDIFTLPKQKNQESLKNFRGFLRVTLSKLSLKVQMDPFAYNHEFKPNHSFGDVAGVNMVRMSLKKILVSTTFILLLFKSNIM